MNSIYDFIVEPIGERYNNTTKVDNKDLILNCNIESFKFINKLAKVISTPKAYNTVIKKDDEIVKILVYFIVKKKSQGGPKKLCLLS